LGEDHPFECLLDGTGERPELAVCCLSQRPAVDPKLTFDPAETDQLRDTFNLEVTTAPRKI
jgi:hypothetical protein